MELSVIILSYNTKKLLRDCLDSVVGQTRGVTFEVIVVDNGSKDGSVFLVKRLQNQKTAKGRPEFNLKLVENKKNLGFAAGNNIGIKKAKGKYVLLLNSDTVLKNNPFFYLVNFAKKHPRAGVIGCKMLNKDGSAQPSAASFFSLPIVFLWLFTGDRFLRRSPSKAGRVDWVAGACMMINKKVIEKIGLLDESFFMYMEESEFCYRSFKAGFETWFCPEAQVYHLIRGSSPEGKQKAICWIYEGLIYYYQKHFASWQLSVLRLLLTVKAATAWLIGVIAGSKYLKETYAKAFKIACHG